MNLSDEEAAAIDEKLRGLVVNDTLFSDLDTGELYIGQYLLIFSVIDGELDVELQEAG